MNTEVTENEKAGAFIGGLSGAFAGSVAGIVLGGIAGAVSGETGVAGFFKGALTGLLAGAGIGGTAGALVEHRPEPEYLEGDEDGYKVEETQDRQVGSEERQEDAESADSSPCFLRRVVKKVVADEARD